jgi:PAS domain S-box-containing protein
VEPAKERSSILLVDDHPANLVALEAILAPLGQDLIMATSGEAALREVLQHDDLALILLDVQMTGLNGFETAALIKQHPRCRHIPIIFVTAVGRHFDHVFRGYSEGAVDYLVKPINPEILRSKAGVFVDLYLKEEKIKHQQRLLHEHERATLERQSEARYRRLLDTLPQCIWATDPAGRTIYWNQAAVEYCGLTADVIRAESFWQCFHPEDRDEARGTFERELRAGTPFDRQARLKRAADGVYRWHLVRVVPEKDEADAVAGAGAILGWIATATDIDDQKRAEETLCNAIVLRDDFLSVASHELKTPLTTLKLEMANLLRLVRRGSPEEGLTARLQRMDAQAMRLNHLIDELLDVSRIAAGRLDFDFDDVDLTDVVSDVALRFAEDAVRRGGSIDVFAPETAVGRWDRSRLDQIVTNLVSNAVKYGEGKPIEVVVQTRDDRATLVVRDHGVGIYPRDHARIFERFERAVPSRHYGGIGLGLWIVRQIVQALGGSVGVESRPGAGSTFTVELPLSREREASSARTERTAEMQAASTASRV